MFENLPTDAWFYMVAATAVIVTGISKGGFGGIALLAVPLMSLVIDPVLAAAIMLPLLLATDAFGVVNWRKGADWRHLKLLLPGALAGIITGAFSAKFVTADTARLIVGIIAICFCLYSWFGKAFLRQEPSPTPHPSGVFWGAVAGFTSYIAHAGAPPFHIYLLPKNLDKAGFAATGVWFFALVNLGKLPAYIATGQLTMSAFATAIVLMPLVPVGFYLGVWLNRRVPHEIFYRIVYIAVFLTGLKLIHSTLC